MLPILRALFNPVVCAPLPLLKKNIYNMDGCMDRRKEGPPQRWHINETLLCGCGLCCDRFQNVPLIQRNRKDFCQIAVWFCLSVENLPIGWVLGSR